MFIELEVVSPEGTKKEIININHIVKIKGEKDFTYIYLIDQILRTRVKATDVFRLINKN